MTRRDATEDAQGAQSAAPAGRLQRRKAKTRTRLLAGAHRLMCEKGVDDTTIQEITEIADVGFGTFYNYFTSKDDIAAQVLDCVINTLGRRNDLANAAAPAANPAQVMANSMRLVAHEMVTDPMWQWWVKRPELLVERMRLGFAPFGLRDMRAAKKAKLFAICNDDDETAWSFAMWLLVAGAKDILDGHRPVDVAHAAAEAVMRLLGTDRAAAKAIAAGGLPAYPELDVDFGFTMATVKAIDW